MHTDLSRITNGLILNTSWMKETGISNGKTGSVLFFYCMAGRTLERLHERYAEMVFEEVFNDISLDTPADFADGLAGIGWATNWLIANKFMDAEADVLDDFDQTIVSRGRQDIAYTPEYTTGLFIYCASRICNPRQTRPKDHILYHGLQHAVNHLHEQYTVESPRKFDIGWTYPWILWHLDLLSHRNTHIQGISDLQNKLIHEAETLQQSSDLHPGNKLFLNLILQNTGHKVPDLEYESDWLQTLGSPAVKNGVAGILLLLTIFSEEKDYISLKHEVAERLESYASDENPYIYDLGDTPLQHRFGLLEGIAGIGLTRLLAKDE